MKTTYILVDDAIYTVVKVALCSNFRQAIRELNPSPSQRIFVEIRTTDKSE